MKKKEEIKILIVDDDKEYNDILRDNLVAHGYTNIVQAYNGDEALTKVYSEKPDVVILDVVLPVLAGWEVSKSIKEDPEISDTKVIILTDIGPDLNKETSPQFGADAYLDKPLEFQELEAAIKKVLDE